MNLRLEKRRQGAITVSRRLAVENPCQLGRMFRGIGFIPLQMDVDVMYDTIKYYGFSPLFEKVDRGTVVPSYLVKGHKEEGKPTKYTVEKETASC